jgi:LCP family protein required for cell wall assembly
MSKNINFLAYNFIPARNSLLIFMIALLAAEMIFMMVVFILNMFPLMYVMITIAIILIVDIVILKLFSARKKNTLQHLAGLIVMMIFVSFLLLIGYYLLSTLITASKITVDDDKVSAVEVTEEPFNVYISGSDSRKSVAEISRTDVNMIMTVNPKTHTILLTSIPRDAYVPLASNGQMDKLTHSAIYGIDEAVNTISDWTGIEMDYYVRVDFKMLRGLVDAVGRVPIENEQEFYSHTRGFYFRKGKIDMSGAQALEYVRERKAFDKDDQQRIINQQKVLKAIIKKIVNSKTILLSYTRILDVIEGHMITDFADNDIAKMVKFQLKGMPEWKVKTQTITGEDARMGTYSMGFGRELDVFIIDEESKEEATANIEKVMMEKEE